MSIPSAYSDDLAWCEIDDTLIFLDIANDRYYRLDDKRNHTTSENQRRANLPAWHQPSRFPRPTRWLAATHVSDAINLGPFRIGEVARALWTQRRTEKRLAQRGFASLLDDARQVRENRACELRLTAESARRTVRAFEHARLLRTAADRCLPRSIALMHCLAARGAHAYVVIGVRLAPFGAHCWVEADGAVLNDSVEETARYRPILVL